jgi:hypothetical protein
MCFRLSKADATDTNQITNITVIWLISIVQIFSYLSCSTKFFQTENFYLTDRN